MMDFWKSCEMGSQITITICLTIIILVIITVCSFLFWQCKCCKAKNEATPNDSISQDSSNGDKGISQAKSDDKNREIRQKEEDRAKALIKDLFEATREKKINSANQKEEKCDINVTKELEALYEKVLKNMRSYYIEKTNNESI